MQPELSSLTQAILHELLTRAEQPHRRQVVRLRLNDRDHAAYFTLDDGATRRDTNRSLRRLEAERLVRLHWQQWEENNWLTAVDLLPGQSAALSQLLGRTPRATQDDALRQLLQAQPRHAGWHADFIAWALAQLDDYRSVAPLERGNPTLNQDILQALATLAILQTPTLERSLSVRLFGDSKRLSALRSAVLRVLRRHDPGAAAFDDDDWALLRAYHLDRVPEYVPLAGAIKLRFETAPYELDLSEFQPSVALSAAMLQHAAAADIKARAIITVENATSFSELLFVRPSDIAAIYTGGFASPTAIRLLRAIRTAHRRVAFFHWGDMDAGGLRILAHLRMQVGEVLPLAMDPAHFVTAQAHAQALTREDRQALSALRQSPALIDCVPLIDCLLSADQKLEQEAISTATVLASL